MGVVQWIIWLLVFDGVFLTAITTAVNSPINENRRCEYSQFACGDKANTCIEENLRCDGTAQCPNKKDEVRCCPIGLADGKNHLFKKLWYCGGIHCPDMMVHCDGQVDCKDGSDEFGCYPVERNSTSTTIRTSTVSEFTVPSTTPSTLTTISTTRAPSTTISTTTLPLTTISKTRAPSTTISTTPLPLTTISKTRAPSTTISTTPLPLTTISKTRAPSTTISTTTLPLTTISTTRAPSTTISTTPLPLTTISKTRAPSTTISKTRAPSTTTSTTPSLATTTSKPKDFCIDKNGPGDWFRCNNQSSSACIRTSQVCDHTKDCGHGEDEAEHCTSDPCYRCSHYCDKRTKQCRCLEGYQIEKDNVTCTDINECTTKTHQCSQVCNNSPGSYQCLCEQGYILVDQYNCSLTGVAPLLYYATQTQINAYDLRRRHQFPVIEAAPGEKISAMERVGNSLFYVVTYYHQESTAPEHSKVYQVGLNQENQPLGQSEVMFRDQASRIYDLSVDYLSGYVYLLEATRLIVCSPDPLYCATLRSNLSAATSLRVVPAIAKLLWTENGNSNRPGVYAAELDATDEQALCSYAKWPMSLAWDDALKRVYFTEESTRSIEFVDLKDKSHHFVQKHAANQVLKLTVLENRIYFINWEDGSLITCHKLTGDRCHRVFSTITQGANKLVTLSMYHPNLHQNVADNPCLSGRHLCTHFCFRSSSAPRRFRCACPDRMALAQDGLSCIDKSDQPFLLLTTAHSAWKLYLDDIQGNLEKVSITTTNDQSQGIAVTLTELAFNFATDDLFVYDGLHKIIGHFALRQTKASLRWRVLANLGAAHDVAAIVFDVNTDNLYWVDMARGTLEVCTIYNGPVRRATITKGLGHPISLALHAKERKWYIGVYDSPPKIVSVSMDGAVVQELALQRVGLPHVLAFASITNQLIWGDPASQRIKSIFINGTELMSSLPPITATNAGVYLINSLAVHNRTIFWTNRDTSAVYHSTLVGWAATKNRGWIADRLPQTYERTFESLVAQDGLSRGGPLKVAIAAMERPLYDHCAAGYHHCDHICMIDATKGYKCVCADGHYSPGGDGTGCVKDPQYVPEEMPPSDGSSPKKPWNASDRLDKLMAEVENDSQWNEVMGPLAENDVPAKKSFGSLVLAEIGRFSVIALVMVFSTACGFVAYYGCQRISHRRRLMGIPMVVSWSRARAVPAPQAADGQPASVPEINEAVRANPNKAMADDDVILFHHPFLNGQPGQEDENHNQKAGPSN